MVLRRRGGCRDGRCRHSRFLNTWRCRLPWFRLRLVPGSEPNTQRNTHGGDRDNGSRGKSHPLSRRLLRRYAGILSYSNWLWFRRRSFNVRSFGPCKFWLWHDAISGYRFSVARQRAQLLTSRFLPQRQSDARFGVRFRLAASGSMSRFDRRTARLQKPSATAVSDARPRSVSTAFIALQSVLNDSPADSPPAGASIVASGNAD